MSLKKTLKPLPRSIIPSVAALLLIAGMGLAATPAQAHSPGVLPTATTLTPAQQMARMTLAQRIGQLFMTQANATGAGTATMNVLRYWHVGNVYLSGRSAGGVNATAGVIRQMTATVSASTTANEYLLVATDQEGGYVQVLSGPGFSNIPTGQAQGTMSPASLKTNATNWGNQLRWAGLKMNLAPVLDTVTQQFAPFNAPIGYYQREYGYTPAAVSAEGNAFLLGMKAGYIAPVAKHFPGLGRVSGNTDVSTNVTDTQTTVNDVNLLPFKTAIANKTRFIMVSSAYYKRIDSRPGKIGPFSTVIMNTMLRSNLGFKGVIISDDLCNAAQLSSWSWATRATNFINAGGSMLLCGNPNALPNMIGAVQKLAQSNPEFLAKVNAAALNVLTAKAAGA